MRYGKFLIILYVNKTNYEYFFSKIRFFVNFFTHLEKNITYEMYNNNSDHLIPINCFLVKFLVIFENHFLLKIFEKNYVRKKIISFDFISNFNC